MWVSFVAQTHTSITIIMADSSETTSNRIRSQALNSGERRGTNDLDARQTPTKKLAGWELREQLKSRTRPLPSGPRKPKSSLDGVVDPNLPPAFRAAFTRQRRKGIDDFNSLASVHTASSAVMTENTANASDSDDSSFDGHDSFASLGDEDDDDEAYREGRNQIARQTVECSRTVASGSKKSLLKNTEFRFKKSGGVHGTPLDFIAE